jgi:hypothetical protein
VESEPLYSRRAKAESLTQAPETQMKQILAVVLLSFFLTGCEVGIDCGEPNMGGSQVAKIEYPTVNLPVSLREQNWEGVEGEGSCAHATMVSLFRWQGRYGTAYRWRHTYGDGEVADSTWDSRNNLANKLIREGVRFAYTTDGDVSFLDWACSTRRGCGVTIMGGKHMVCLVHFDKKWAALMDSNDTDIIIWIPRQTFIAEWENSNGWAVTPVYTPAPPLP